jgi:hypothetical protein
VHIKIKWANITQNRSESTCVCLKVGLSENVQRFLQKFGGDYMQLCWIYDKQHGIVKKLCDAVLIVYCSQPSSNGVIETEF